MLLLVFHIYSFSFILKSASESITKTNLTLPDYIFTIGYFINNFKHLLVLFSGDIEINPGQNDHLTLNFVVELKWLSCS